MAVSLVVDQKQFKLIQSGTISYVVLAKYYEGIEPGTIVIMQMRDPDGHTTHHYMNRVVQYVQQTLSGNGVILSLSDRPFHELG